MCGIAGILVAQGTVPLDDLERMVAVQAHRGPDGYGLYRDGPVGLGHARLSIIDVSGGAQPLRNEDGSVWVTFNGEIFNYIELRRDLEALGHRFRTASDTEVIVHAYEQWGERAWGRFNGQFAFGLWDAGRRRLWLVRDPFGIHPLHYSVAGARVVFASEVKALFASRHVTPRFDPEGLLHVFTRWSAPAPGTVFAGVRSVAPGGWVSFDTDLREESGAWWAPDFRTDPGLARSSLEALVERLEHLLREAVALRLRADVPVGAYLSGGLDSSLITTLIQRSESSPLRTFSIRFEDPAFDETEPQRAMVRALQTGHEEVLVRNRDIADHLPAVVRHCETPLLRTAPVPLFLLSGLVRRAGMKVVLTGEGADELFAGYSIFKEDKIRRFWARRPGSAWRSAPLARVHHYVGGPHGHEGQMWREFFRRGLTETDAPFYSHRVRWENTGWGTRFLRRELIAGVNAASLDAQVERLLPAGWRHWPPLSRAQLIEVATFMSPYLLVSQGDRVALGHGVEVRYPFLDPGVIAFSGGLPPGVKMRGLRDKFLLRALGSRHLPPAIWNRPKQPYRAPTSPVFFGPDAPDYVRELLSHEALARHGLVDPRPAHLLAEKARARAGVMSGEREEMALVGILTLQILAEWLSRGFPGEAADAHRRLRSKAPDILEDRCTGAAGAARNGKSGSGLTFRMERSP